jgi:molybdopterin molybdotransferase
MNMPITVPRDMLGRGQVLSLAEAKSLVALYLPPPSVAGESLALEEALGRTTMQEITAPEHLPAHARSIMDGYAVRARDTFGASESLPAYLAITGEVLMGERPERGPAEGACFRIATGGLLPPGTDAVVMLEHTVQVDETMIEVVQPVAEGTNVIGVGEDVRQAAAVLPAGHRLRPQDLGLLAGLGIRQVLVRQRLRVGIISTGDEIVPFDQTPPPGKIRDMNAVTLAAMVRELGGIPNYYGIVADEEERFRAVAEESLAANDLLIFSGSSSVGVRDMGERVLDSLGAPGIIVHGVAIKPGKPVMIALASGKPLFGLPGHPVAAAVAFDLFVRPAMRHLGGRTADGLPECRTLRARLMRNVNSAAGRRDFIRVQVRPASQAGEFAEAYPVLGKSGALSTMVRAHGYLILPEAQQGVGQGELVDVHLFG